MRILEIYAKYTIAYILFFAQWKPIAFASRTLSGAEQKYAQLEKEGLACIFGIKKFRSYLYGRPFEICTDHKPTGYPVQLL